MILKPRELAELLLSPIVNDIIASVLTGNLPIRLAFVAFGSDKRPIGYGAVPALQVGASVVEPVAACVQIFRLPSEPKSQSTATLSFTPAPMP
jgi:hypothetical protein